jgi:hypothetical protein
MTFTPPASGSTRLSPDVWELLCAHAQNNGNSSPREALEQLVRQALGNAQSVMLHCLDPATHSCNDNDSTAMSLSSVGNAAAALDALLLE